MRMGGALDGEADDVEIVIPAKAGTS